MLKSRTTLKTQLGRSSLRVCRTLDLVSSLTGSYSPYVDIFSLWQRSFTSIPFERQLTRLLLRLYSAEYVWDDGRKSYPLFFLYWCPYSVAVVDGTLYASTKTRLCTALSINKVCSLPPKQNQTNVLFCFLHGHHAFPCLTRSVCCSLSFDVQIFDSRDKDELTYDWLSNKIKFFK